MDKQWQLMYDLTMADAPSGNEKEARDVMQRFVKPLADKVEVDRLGSLIAVQNGAENGPKIMVAGHLDEIGFMVTRITDGGYIKFQTLGGWWGQNMLSQRVTVTNRDGKKFVGVIGSKPPHILPADERNKPADIKDMYIDLGVDSKEEVAALGIRPGDTITPYCESMKMANEKYLLAKAWDNRVGCAVAALVLEQLKDKKVDGTVYGVGTVQEEVGCRGAQTSSYKIQPDIGFAVDVCISQSLGVTEENVLSKLGGGPALGLFDAGMIGHKALREFVENIADELNIPYQYDSMAGGATDGAKIHMIHEGTPTINVSIPSRYIHSNVSIIHQDDIDNAVKLIVAAIERLDNKTVETITYGK
nr:M42 family metallopeptidase [Culicoidibacter larvae]